MLAMLEAPRRSEDERPAVSDDALAVAVCAMGRRLREGYLDGAIPYLRECEPDLWARLSALDAEDSPEALADYERLFREGLDRYVGALRRKAA